MRSSFWRGNRRCSIPPMSATWDSARADSRRRRPRRLRQQLATDSREAGMFFSNLRRALTTGYFIEEDAATGDLKTVAVPGYVYHPDRGGAASQPIGFGLFKAIRRRLRALADRRRPGVARPRPRPGDAAGRCSARRRAAWPTSSGCSASAATAPRWRICWRSYDYTPTSEVTHQTSWFIRGDAPPALRAHYLPPGKPHGDALTLGRRAGAPGASPRPAASGGTRRFAAMRSSRARPEHVAA